MPDRLQLSRTRTLPPGAIGVARKSLLGNPWVVGDPGRVWLPYDTGRGYLRQALLHKPMSACDCVTAHRVWLRDGTPLLPADLTPAGIGYHSDGFAQLRERILAALPALRGKPLACWCRPHTPCHADTLMEIANG